MKIDGIESELTLGMCIGHNNDNISGNALTDFYRHIIDAVARNCQTFREYSLYVWPLFVLCSSSVTHYATRMERTFVIVDIFCGGGHVLAVDAGSHLIQPSR